MSTTSCSSYAQTGVVLASRSLELELAIWRTEKAHPVLARSAEADPQRLTILVADDDSDMRAYVARCLRRDPIVGRVVAVADGKAALEAMQHGGIDLIISDVEMPGLDGLALCRALLADAVCRSVPVLLITGHALPAERPANARQVLVKPFNARALHESLLRLLPGGSERAPPS